MCWRCDTAAGREESDRQFEEIARARILRSVDAHKGDNVHTNTYPEFGSDGRRYFRQDYFRKLTGPTHTTELLIKEGTVVVVTKMPESVRSEFKLRARDPEEDKPNNTKHGKLGGPRARVVKVGDKIGFSFGKTGSKIFYPLDTDELTRFRIISVPR